MQRYKVRMTYFRVIDVEVEAEDRMAARLKAREGFPLEGGVLQVNEVTEIEPQNESEGE